MRIFNCFMIKASKAEKIIEQKINRTLKGFYWTYVMIGDDERLIYLIYYFAAAMS